jgi:hypothetical protein
MTICSSKGYFEHSSLLAATLSLTNFAELQPFALFAEVTASFASLRRRAFATLGLRFTQP